MHDTRTPVVAGIAIIVMNIALGAALLKPMGYVGLALALSASTTVEAVILGTVLKRRLGGADRTFSSWLWRVIAASVVVAGACALLAPPLTAATSPGAGPRWQQIVVFLVALAVAAVVYAGAAWILRIPELMLTAGQAARRLPGLQGLRARLPG